MAEQTATLTKTASNFVVFDNIARAAHGFTHKIIVTGADIAAAAAYAVNDTLLLTLATLPATSIVLNAAAYNVSAFNDAVVATLAVGLGADPDAVIDEYNPNAASVQKFVGTGSTSASAQALTLNVVPETGADLDDTTTGTVEIFLKLATLKDVD